MSHYRAAASKKRSASDMASSEAKYAEIRARIEARELSEALDAQVTNTSNQFESLQVNTTTGTSSSDPSGMNVETGSIPVQEPPKKKQNVTGTNETVPKTIAGLEKALFELQHPALGSATAPTAPAANSYSLVATAASAAAPGDVDMTGTESSQASAPEQVPVRVQRRPQPDRYQYRKIPDTLQMSAIIQVEGAMDIGSLHPVDKTLYFATGYLDFGRHALPGLAIGFSAPAPASGKPTETPGSQDGNARRTMHLEWQTGVEVTPINSDNKRYQIEGLTVHDTAEMAAYEGVVNQEISDAANDPKKRERLVKISWTGNECRIRLSKGTSKGNFTQFAPPAVRHTINTLTGNETAKITMWFLLRDGMTVLDFVASEATHGSPSKPNMFGYLQMFCKKRTPPYAYLSSNFGRGDLDVDMDMAAIDIAGNRMLARYAANQEDWLKEQERDKDAAPFAYPPTSNFYAYRKQLHFATKEDFVKVVGTSAVRSYQYEEGEYARLAFGLHSIKVRKVTRITQKELEAKKEFVDVEVDRAAAHKRRMMYGYVNLYQQDRLNHPLPIPVDGTVFKIDVEERGVASERIHHDRSLQWNGYVKEMTEEEKSKVPEASFLLVMSRPRGGKKIAASDSLNGMKPQRVSLTHVVNKTHCRRILEAVKELANPDRTDMDDILWPLMFSQESHAKVAWDLTRGPADTDDNGRIYKEAATELVNKPPEIMMDDDETEFTADQLDIFLETWKAVPNKVKIILGSAGSQKTTTLAWSCVLLQTVGHKIEVLSEQNEAANKFCRLVWRLQRYAKEHYKFGKYLQAKKILRFVPPAFEIQALKHELDRIQVSEDEILIIGKNDPLDYKETPEYIAVLDNLRSYLEDQQSNENPDDEVTMKAKTDEVSQYVEKFKEDHTRLDPKERVFEMPIECSMGYHIEQMRQSNPELFTKYADAEKAMNESRQDDVNSQETHENFTSQAEALMGMVLANTDVLVGTYLSAAHSLCQEYHKSTIVANEESCQTTIATAAIGITLRDIHCHIYIGDEFQLPPHSSARGVDEFHTTTRLSILKWLLVKGVPFTRLKKQFRMHPSISRFPNKAFYSGEVEDANCTKKDNANRELFRSMVNQRYGGPSATHDQTSQYFGVNVKYGVSAPVPGGTSLQNFASATAITEAIGDLTRLGASPSDICIICYYGGQRSRVRTLIPDQRVEVHTVEKFQGSDKPFMFLDFTAAPAPHVRFEGVMGREATRTLSSHVTLPERLCVALTRAKDGLLVFGNFGSWNFKTARTTRQDAAMLEGMLMDMITRNVVLHDDARDTNPLIRSIVTSVEAIAEHEAVLKKADELGWMSQVRHRYKPSKLSTVPLHVSEDKIEYAGQQFGKAHGSVPAAMREQAVERATREGAERVPAPSKAASKKLVIRDTPEPESRRRGGGLGRGQIPRGRGGSRGAGGPRGARGS